MAVGYCKDCIHYDYAKSWCYLRREEHENEYYECTPSEGFNDGSDNGEE